MLNLQVNVLNACVFNLLISILLFLTCSFVLINVEHFKTLSIGHHNLIYYIIFFITILHCIILVNEKHFRALCCFHAV